MSHWRGHPFSLVITLAGAAYMAMLVFGLVLRPEAPFIGTRLYDVYARALLNGSFALPLAFATGVLQQPAYQR